MNELGIEMISQNIKTAVSNPKFYNSKMEEIQEVLDRCDLLDSKTIKILLKNGLSSFGISFILMLKYIKCLNLEENIEDVLEELDSIPIFKEIKRIIINLKEEKQYDHDILYSYGTNFELCLNFENKELMKKLNNLETVLKEKEQKIEDLKQLLANHVRDHEALIEKEQMKTVLLKENEQLRAELKKKNIRYEITKELQPSFKIKSQRILKDEEYDKLLNDIKQKDISSITEALLKDPELIFATNSYKQTILHLCVVNEYIEGVKLILDILCWNREWIEKNEQNELTPLLLASREGCVDIIKLLVSNGANTEATDKYGNSPLFLAVASNRLNVVEYLLSIGAKLNIINKDSNNLLTTACFNENIEMAKLLLDNGIERDFKRKDGKTPLNCACMRGHLGIVKLLIEKGANLETKDKFGLTPLMNSVIYNNNDTVEYLLNAGANVNEKNNNGKTALHIARERKNEKAMNILNCYY